MGKLYEVKYDVIDNKSLILSDIFYTLSNNYLKEIMEFNGEELTIGIKQVNEIQIDEVLKQIRDNNYYGDIKLKQLIEEATE